MSKGLRLHSASSSPAAQFMLNFGIDGDISPWSNCGTGFILEMPGKPVMELNVQLTVTWTYFVDEVCA